MRKQLPFVLLIMGACLFTAAISHAADTPLPLSCTMTTTPPEIDGSADDHAWQNVPAISVKDGIVNVTFSIKAVHDGEHVYLLVSFADKNENREHGTLYWDDLLSTYQSGPEREDLFVIKWAMEPHDSGLTLKEEQPYTADIWYWKANRTDPVGYADDKMHHYTRLKSPKSVPILTPRGFLFYLSRPADKGKGAYTPIRYDKKQDIRMPKYAVTPPIGSRADVRAKGIWTDGRWVVEFKRKLDTGHKDDVRFEMGKAYRFGISRHEIAGRKPDPTAEQPLYGAGEIGRLISLQFKDGM